MTKHHTNFWGGGGGGGDIQGPPPLYETLCKSTHDMPKHLSGEQMIHYLENKLLEKKGLEEEKVKRQEEREPM